MTEPHEVPLTDTFLRDFGSKWERAWNSHDTGQVLELLHPEIVWEDTVFWPRVIEGRVGMPAYIEAICRVMPDVEFAEVQFFSAPGDGRALYLVRLTPSLASNCGRQ